jgi:membrane protease YdiL (CAAX protease family)
MRQLIRNKYVIVFSLLYSIAIAVLILIFHQPFMDIVTPFLFFGILFSFIAWLLVKNSAPLLADKAAFKGELIVIITLVLFFTWYVTYGSSTINKLIPLSIIAVEWKNTIAIVIKKLLTFVLLPFLVYKVAGFSVKDFGLAIDRKKIFRKKTILVFVVLSAMVLLYQYFLSGGAKPVRNGQFNSHQLLTSLPLLFLWLFIEAGLVEEFFFRAVLQSRIAALLKSPVAGIIISGLIFGLAHAPGLYLRGAESEGISEQLPFIFWAAYTITAMSVAGIFLGVIWKYTKNLYLVMALHAMVDLLPNFSEFVHIWQL